MKDEVKKEEEFTCLNACFGETGITCKNHAIECTCQDINDHDEHVLTKASQTCIHQNNKRVRVKQTLQ